MDLHLLAIWATLFGAVATLALLVAWASTGQQNSTLRTLAGLCVIFTMVCFAYVRLAG
jgi:hypothetical protein